MMKNKIDFCRIQWLNREFLPEDYVYKWNKNESRFSRIFESLYFDNNSPEETKSPSAYYDERGNVQSNNSSLILSNGSIKESKFLSLFNFNNSFDNPKILETQKTQNSKHKSNDIDLFKILTQEDQRTTLMIKNIPNKFTKDHFLSIFNKNFEGKFNLFLLPTDIKEKKNYGYAFINFINYFYIINFYYSFNGKKWENTNSVKICEILYSKIQGITKMIKHYPIKVMYLRELENQDSKEEDEKSNSNNSSNSNSNNANTQLLPKVDIPLIYQQIFEKIYPNIRIEYEANNKEVFSIELRNLLLFNPKNE